MNSTRFQGKGKRRQHETYNRDARGNYRKHDHGKGKGRPQNQGNRRQQPEDTRNRFTQNSTQSKGKGRSQGKGKGKYGGEKGKGKGQGKGQSFFGHKKENKEETPMTNNSLTIYLEEPTTVGSDDETTIVFTQNMNRIMMGTGPAKQNTHEDDNNESIVDIIRKMNNLPDHHEVWEYIDPTRAYYTQNWTSDYLDNDETRSFIDWYDYQLNVLAELKGDKTSKCNSELLKWITNQRQRQDNWGSSTVEFQPTWGNNRQSNEEKDLKQWEDTPTRKQKKTHQMRPCQTCGDQMPTEQDKLSPNCMTCQVLDDTEQTNTEQKKGYAREERDDEDYHTDFDTDSDDDETHKVFTQNMNKIKLNEDNNVMRANDTDDHTILPIVEPLSTYTYPQALTSLFTTAEEINTSSAKALTADDIAFLIGHADGVVQTHELSPIPKHKNIYEDLQEVYDKITFTQNMPGMTKGDHKRKLTKEEKMMDNETKNSRLQLFSYLTEQSSPSVHHEEHTRENLRTRNRAQRKYQRLSSSPITIPGTPDNQPPPRKPRRFPVPDYSHRDTNYHQPPLCDRRLINDYYAFPHKWTKDTAHQRTIKRQDPY